MRKLFLIFLLVLYTSGFSQTIDIETYATGFDRPLEIVNAGDDRLFIVEQPGTIQILNSDQTVNTTPFLDISSMISTGGERGLLGLAFHPDYSSNGFFYVYFTDLSGASQLSRFTVSTDQNIADAGSRMDLLNIAQPQANHNGGRLAFGPEGYLYIAVGDGGGSGDPDDNGQNATNLLGSLLRIDVDGGTPYGIPSTNPFAGSSIFKEEIWAYGLRNPWKFSFDGNDLWIADVGQNSVEEINKISANDTEVNFGWRCYEGNSIFNLTDCPDTSTLEFPVATYSHNDGILKCSITGGYVYRGTEYPSLQGNYIFADFCSNEIGMLAADGSDAYAIELFGPFDTGNISSFGVDHMNHLYISGITTGTVYKIVDADALNLNKPSLQSIKLQPNPARDYVKIILPNSTPLATVAIYDVLGKLARSGRSIKSNETMDVSMLKRGVYLVQIILSDNSMVTKKMIIR